MTVKPERPDPALMSSRRLVVTAVVVGILTAACSSAETGEDATASQPETTANQTQSDSSAASTTTSSTDGDESADSAEPAIPVDDIPEGMTAITIESSTDDYFVLYVRPGPDSERELPVAIVRGEEGSTTLTDGRWQLPDDYYRVETRSIASPGDVDGDGVDDLTELDDQENANPFNPAEALTIDLGSIIIANHETYETLSYQGDDVARDAYLAGIEFVKFYIIDYDEDNPTVYFMNTETFRAHPRFAEAIGLPGGRGPRAGTMRGDIAYDPEGVAPDGSLGTYRFAFQPNDAYAFEDIAVAYEVLVSSMPYLTNNLNYEPYESAALPRYEVEKDLYDAYRVPILLR